MKKMLLVLLVGSLLGGCGSDEKKKRKRDDRDDRSGERGSQRRDDRSSSLGSRIRGAEKQKTRAMFMDYLTALVQYKETYKYYPLIFTSEEPVGLGEPDNRDKFIIALKGKKLVNDQWLDLDGQETRYNRQRREFLDFSVEDFDEDGYLVDAWGNPHLKIIVDYDRDGFIQLPTDYKVKELDGSRIKGQIALYVLAKDDPNGNGANVFSWVDY